MAVPLVINGATRLYAIVGDPIGQVRSPETYTARMAAAGMNAVLLPMHVPSERFDEVIPAIMGLANLDGLLVTVPFKARMLRFATRTTPAAASMGAVNALRRETDGSWSADMFDGAGFVHAALARGERLRGRRVLQFGAGGAGGAIVWALAEAGVASIRLVDPDSGRVRSLAASTRAAFPQCDVAPATPSREGFDMVVNASPVGMKPGDGLPGDIGTLSADTLVGEAVITERGTALTELAERHGCRWITGREMHAGQIEAIMNFFATTRARM